MSSRRPTSPGAEEILGLYFPVLDHGFVALVDYMGTDECIERAARVSYGYGTRKASLTRGLLRYLRRHLHTTPSEMVEFKFHCCMPMFVARQWIRHRSACLSGDSKLAFDLPGAAQRGRRQYHGVKLEDFHRMWHEGTKVMRARLERMKLRSCNEDTGEIVSTRVVDIWESGVKPVFKVTLEDGRSLKMSKDHRCLTEAGWLTLESATELRLGSEKTLSWSANTPRFAVNGVPAYQDEAWLRERRREGLSVDEIAARAGISYHTIRKYLKLFGLGFTAAEKCRLSARTQKGFKRTSVAPRKISETWRQAVVRARSGAASNFWRGGVATERANIGRWTREQASRVHAQFGYVCAICGGKQRLHAHHVDPVWHAPDRARDFSNLMTLCGPCHERLHADNLELELLSAVQNNRELGAFWANKARLPRPREKRPMRTTQLVRSFSKVVRIEYAGDEMTYDLEVEGPHHNFVADGFIVHNSVNEYSGRYSLMPMLFYTPSAEQLQTQSRSNNQGRSGTSVTDEKYAEAVRRWNEIRDKSSRAYEWMTSEDIARELARIDLPLSTYTQWYWKIDLHNLLHFLKLRVDRHAQWEIQEYGRVMAGMLKKVTPLSYEAWIDYDVCGERMSRMELDAIRKLLAVEGRGIAARSGEKLDASGLEALGIAKREIVELLAKLEPITAPDFELDLSQARSPESFAERFASAVPKIDKPPTE